MKVSRQLSNILYFIALISIVFSMGFIALYLAVGPALPEIDSIQKIRLQTPMRIYSADNQLIAEYGEVKRIPVKLEQIPKNFVNALLSTEDARFYEHSGVDFVGVIRAVVKLITTRTKSQGASTITMQVARNYYLTREKQFSRKFTEMFLAWKLESELSKDKILELYLNKIPFSHHAFGLGAAAQVYYGKAVSDLSLAQLAVLAGIPQAPSRLNPISNPQKAKQRRAHVLARMLNQNYITQMEYQIAIDEPIKTVKHATRTAVEAPYFAEMVRRELVERYGKDIAYNNGFKVYTTLDSTLQQYANDSLREGLEDYDKRHGYRGPEQHFVITSETSLEEMEQWLQQKSVIGKLEPALVTSINDKTKTADIFLKGNIKSQINLADVKWARKYIDENHRGKPIKKISQVLKAGDLIRVRQKQHESNSTDIQSYQLAQLPDTSAGFVSLVPDTGAIEALVGGYDYHSNKFNTVTQANRQIGSSIKPFLYSAAFEKQFTPASIINDMPIVEKGWRPKNSSGNYSGPIRLRTGLMHSKNTVSIRLINEIGTNYTKDYLKKIGFRGENMQPYPSLALGAASFTPLEVVTAYAVLANGGYQVSPWFIQRVEDIEGQLIEKHDPIQVCRKCIRESANKLASKVKSNVNNLNKTSHQNSKVLVAPRVIEARNRYLVDSILKDVIHRGSAWKTLHDSKSNLLKRNDIGGKTGTTNDAKDAWFSGYNTSHVATAWVGFSDHSKKLGEIEFGGKAALPIWRRFMEKTLQSEAIYNHPIPDGIVNVKIDSKTGLLANQFSENTIFEMFRSETVPTNYSGDLISEISKQSKKIVDEDSLF